MFKYQVIDIHTRLVVGEYATRNRALHRANKLDLEYGAIRYRVKPALK